MELRHNFDHNGILESVTLPRYAFKFAPINDYSISSLQDGYLYFSQPDDFNDIFEMPTKARKEYSPSELREYMRANFKHHWPKFGLPVPDENEMDAMIDRHLKEHPELISEMFGKIQAVRKQLVRVCCMSMRYDDPLMWAHYAASFTGMCFVFDFPYLISAGNWFFLQVKYVDSIPTVDPVATSLRLHSSAQGYNDPAANIEYDQVQFGIKLKPWEHEQEIRLCTLSKDPKQTYPADALLGVLIGPRANADAERIVVKAAETSGIRRNIERLEADAQEGVLSITGLKNSLIDVRVTGWRNLAREMRQEP